MPDIKSNYLRVGVVCLLSLSLSGRVNAQESRRGERKTKCSSGQVSNADTSGHCCWPGQAWSRSKSKCVGAPDCPSGTHIEGESCAKKGCKPNDEKGCLARCDHANDAASCEMLGRGYGGGWFGVAKDEEKSTAYYTKACGMGDPEGCKSAGMAYTNGSITKNHTKAFSLYLKGCDLGVPSLCDNVGRAYGKGLGVPKDRSKAIDYYKKSFALYETACNDKNLEACQHVSWCYVQGHGVEKNVEHGLSLYTHLCDGGFAEACVQAGMILQFGKGAVAMDERKAIAVYGRGCALKNKSSCESEKELTDEVMRRGGSQGEAPKDASGDKGGDESPPEPAAAANDKRKRIHACAEGCFSREESCKGKKSCEGGSGAELLRCEQLYFDKWDACAVLSKACIASCEESG